MEKATIKKSDLIALQEQGLTRQEIAVKYEVTREEMNRYFRLLNIKSKAKKKLKYDVIDDTVVPAPAVEETAVSTVI